MLRFGAAYVHLQSSQEGLLRRSGIPSVRAEQRHHRVANVLLNQLTHAEHPECRPIEAR